MARRRKDRNGRTDFPEKQKPGRPVTPLRASGAAPVFVMRGRVRVPSAQAPLDWSFVEPYGWPGWHAFAALGFSL